MNNHSKIKQQPSPARQTSRITWFLLSTALLFVLCGAFLIFAFRSQASTLAPRSQVSSNVSPQVPANTVTTVPQQTPQVTPVATQGNTDKKVGPLQPTITPVPTIVVATPTLIVSTPQHSQYGVFPLSAGGPLPVPESVLHPTNIARMMLGSTLVSVYAGSTARNPQAGILCVLREDLTTGELHLKVYEDPQAAGALTILSIQKNVLKIANTKAQGSFDLNTNTFYW